MTRPTSYDKVMARALKLLSVKPRTEAELRERLLERAPSSEAVVEQAIERLKELSYLNDAQFAADYSRSKLRTKPLGRQRLARELAQKKVPEPIIEATLDRVYEAFDEETLVDRAIEKRRRAHGRPRTPQEAKKLFDHLIRLGFDYELVRQKVRAASRSGMEEAE